MWGWEQCHRPHSFCFIANSPRCPLPMAPRTGPPFASHMGKCHYIACAACKVPICTGHHAVLHACFLGCRVTGSRALQVTAGLTELAQTSVIINADSAALTVMNSECPA